MRPSEKNLEHLRPLVDAMALEMRSAVEAVGGQVVAASRAGVRVHGAEPRSITLPAGGTRTLTVSPCRWMGYLIAETTGTTGVRLRFHDGDSADGDVIGSVTLSPGESVRDYFGPSGVALSYGLFVELLPFPGATDAGGTIDGAVFTAAGD